jgi:NAD(P)-dependent dehydrogenase (short-subunit alcohol dehydrogenase family)
MRGKVVVVTGGFGALGRAVIARGREQGARMAAVDVTAAAPGAEDAWGNVDLGNADAAAKAMADIRAKCGRVDALLNIAGGFAWQTVAEGDPVAWDKMFALNVKTALTASRAALPHLVESKGAIVNVGANAALKAGAGMGAYTASKMGVMKLTESMAEELKGKVRVNAVLPSIIDTPANRKDMPKADFSSWVQPVELANAMLFLASDAASAITGALIPVVGRV